MANERTSSSSSLSEGGTPTVTVGMGSEDAGKKTRNASATAWTKELEPHAIAKTFERRYVTIEGVEYDVTDFKHPGGSVIYYMLSNTGADATEAFKEFHYRSKRRARRWRRCRISQWTRRRGNRSKMRRC